MKRRINFTEINWAFKSTFYNHNSDVGPNSKLKVKINSIEKLRDIGEIESYFAILIYLGYDNSY